MAFNVQSFEHKMTPRRVAVHPSMPCLIVIETDHASYTEVTKNIKRNQMAAVSGSQEISSQFFIISKNEN